MTRGVKAKRKITRRSWSDLPTDITNLIIDRLHYVDQIHFRAVCKSWRAANAIKYADTLPWQMTCNACSCFLYDPFQKREYTIFDNDANRETFAGVTVLASKHGWVLFSKDTSLFFYSPFTDKIIKIIPKLYSRIYVATFSTSPSSPDCLIFVLSVDSKNFYHIKICKPGDKRWTRFWYSEKYPSLPMQAEYVEGVFYCSFPAKEILGGFDIAQKKWKIYPYPPKNPNNVWDFFIEFKGNLLVAQNFRVGETYKWRALRFDQSTSEMKWLKAENLEKGLFLGFTTIFILEKSEEPNEVDDDVSDHYRYYRHQFLLRQLPENREEFAEIWIQPPQPKL